VLSRVRLNADRGSQLGAGRSSSDNVMAETINGLYNDRTDQAPDTPGAASRRPNSPPPNGSTGSTTAASILRHPAVENGFRHCVLNAGHPLTAHLGTGHLDVAQPRGTPHRDARRRRRGPGCPLSTIVTNHQSPTTTASSKERSLSICDPALRNVLRTLKLTGMLDTLDARARQTRDGTFGHLEFLQVRCEDEIASRESAALTRRIRRAKFEEQSTFEGFDFTANAKTTRRDAQGRAAIVGSGANPGSSHELVGWDMPSTDGGGGTEGQDPLRDESVLIIDDCTLYRENLAATLVLNGTAAPSVAWDLPSLVTALEDTTPSIVLLNIATRRSALLLRAAMEINPNPRVIVLGVSEHDESEIVACAEEGVAGYHMRTESLDDLLV
jgi:hypothetical protein